jgi:hypothetical protein
MSERLRFFDIYLGWWLRTRHERKHSRWLIVLAMLVIVAFVAYKVLAVLARALRRFYWPPRY